MGDFIGSGLIIDVLLLSEDGCFIYIVVVIDLFMGCS